MHVSSTKDSFKSNWLVYHVSIQFPISLYTFGFFVYLLYCLYYFTNSSAKYPFLHPLFKQTINQRGVRFISVLHWEESHYDAECSCIPLNFLLWQHKKGDHVWWRHIERAHLFAHHLERRKQFAWFFVWKSLEK